MLYVLVGYESDQKSSSDCVNTVLRDAQQATRGWNPHGTRVAFNLKDQSCTLVFCKHVCGYE